MRFITTADLKRRRKWIDEIAKLGQKFNDDSVRLEGELKAEIKKEGTAALVGHLRMAGDIPEVYGHDTSEEKQYSKYTDALLSEAFKAIGLKSTVLKERADAADVEAFGKDFSLVADAKAFRISRTAKNAKDFKVGSMHGWKKGKDFAIVVCPLHQLPTKASQIYQQASASNVCLMTYAHLSVIVRYADLAGKSNAETLLRAVLDCIKTLKVTKDSVAYWTCLNQTMLSFNKRVHDLWEEEQQAAIEAVVVAKDEATAFLANEETRIRNLSHKDAIADLLRMHKIDKRVGVVRNIASNNLLEFGRPAAR